MQRIKQFAIALLLLPLLAACGDDPAGFGTDVDAAQAAAGREAARQVSRAVVQSNDRHEDMSGWTGMAKAAKAGGSCPSVTFTGSQQESWLEVVLDFGTGCTDGEGDYHEGMVTVRFVGGDVDGLAEITFDDYSNGEESLDGSLSFEPGPPIVQRITDLTVSNAEETVTITMEVETDLDLSAEVPTYSITGSGDIRNDRGERFAFSVVEPIEGDANCPDPMRGVFDVAYADGSGAGIDAQVDFFPNEGGCDDVVSVRVDERGTTISMNE